MESTITTDLQQIPGGDSAGLLVEEEQITTLDVPFTVINVTTTVAAVILPFFFFSWSALVAFLIFYTLTGLGLTAGYHRLFAHRSYTVPKWLEYVLSVCGYLAIQRGPLFWVAMHRLHHKHSDVPGKDPHTPKEGLWHVHFGWAQKRRRDVWDQTLYRRLVPDLAGDPFYAWLDDERKDYATYVLLLVVSFVVGGLVGGAAPFDPYNAVCFFVWVGLLNRVAVLHAFGLINSVCHLVGTRPYQTAGGDESVNNGLVALLIFGEGWHNNHHRFPASARHGLRWYQVDVAWYVIWLLQRVGLARDVRLPKKKS